MQEMERKAQSTFCNCGKKQEWPEMGSTEKAVSPKACMKNFPSTRRAWRHSLPCLTRQLNAATRLQKAANYFRNETKAGGSAAVCGEWRKRRAERSI